MSANVPPHERKILVVEDDPNSREVICEALLDKGYKIERAETADEAFDKLQTFTPHLVLTDHDMPGMSGLEMMEELRKQKNYVTVIFISGRSDIKTIVDALDAGADDYIRKPFRFSELFARIETCLRTNDLHRDLLVANEKLQGLVDKDYLTGLYNMRSMYEKVDFELKRAKRFDRIVSCVMLDMDHFKTVNDTNDHLFGSFVLKEMGTLIRKNIRETDLAARYGGDEFLVVLTETDQKGTEIFCERLRSTVENYVFKNENAEMKLTVSMGYALSHGNDNLDARELVRKADHALYIAKEQGRNTFATG